LTFRDGNVSFQLSLRRFKLTNKVAASLYFFFHPLGFGDDVGFFVIGCLFDWNNIVAFMIRDDANMTNTDLTLIMKAEKPRYLSFVVLLRAKRLPL